MNEQANGNVGQKIAVALVVEADGSFTWVPGPAANAIQDAVLLTAVEVFRANIVDGIRQKASMPQPVSIEHADESLLRMLRKRQGG
jgi:hypothetical protein